MTRFLATAAALTLTFGVSVASAQELTQSGVVGPSGNAEYPDLVQASNNVIYLCKPAVNNVRTCIVQNPGGIGLDAGAGAIGGSILVAVVASGSGSSTTTTN